MFIKAITKRLESVPDINNHTVQCLHGLLTEHNAEFGKDCYYVTLHNLHIEGKPVIAEAYVHTTLPRYDAKELKYLPGPGSCFVANLKPIYMSPKFIGMLLTSDFTWIPGDPYAPILTDGQPENQQ